MIRYRIARNAVVSCDNCCQKTGQDKHLLQGMMVLDIPQCNIMRSDSVDANGATLSVTASRASLLYCPAPSRGSYSGAPGGSGPSIGMLYRSAQSAFVGMPTFFFSSSVENSTCPATNDNTSLTRHVTWHALANIDSLLWHMSSAVQVMWG